MSYVDQEFAMRILSSERNYKVTLSPFKINCSCPLCGDSATDRFKARFWFYEYKNEWLVHCYNCDATFAFYKFLENRDDTMYREYLLEKRKESTFGRVDPPKTEPIDLNKFSATIPKKIDDLKYCVRLDTLPEEHPIIKYVKSRMIPSNQWDRLWFTSDWQKLVNEHKPTYDEPKTEYRLVIPIYNSDGEIESFQGRALSPNARQKYMTIKAHEDASKIYGMDRVDGSKNVYIFEGPLDSLFIPNTIAITGGSLNLESVPFPKTRVWVLDNEPRHEDVKKRVMKLIDAGERVIIWDNSPWHAKDVNEMITEEKATPNEILEYFESNIISGLMAKLRANNWFKI